MMNPPHISVLLNEVLQAFEGRSLHSFIDGTLGAGGHAEEILQAHPELELFLGIDQDPAALAKAQTRLTPWKDKTKFFQGNFCQLDSYAKSLPVKLYDGILVDLGVSSMQLDQAERGFSFMKNGPLDMRMNPQDELTAEEIVNTWSEKELGRIFRDYGEEKHWRAAARAIVSAREKKPIHTTVELTNILDPVLRSRKPKQGIHPLTLVFQALRISVNRELDVLESFLPKALELLTKGGRLAVISFHSLEDRIVKNFFRFAASDKMNTVGLGGLFLDKEPAVQLVTKKPLCASDEEICMNPRSRSAKLRIIEKL